MGGTMRGEVWVGETPMGGGGYGWGLEGGLLGEYEGSMDGKGTHGWGSHGWGVPWRGVSCEWGGHPWEGGGDTGGEGPMGGWGGLWVGGSPMAGASHWVPLGWVGGPLGSFWVPLSGCGEVPWVGGSLGVASHLCPPHLSLCLSLPGRQSSHVRGDGRSLRPGPAPLCPPDSR